MLSQAKMALYSKLSHAEIRYVLCLVVPRWRYVLRVVVLRYITLYAQSWMALRSTRSRVKMHFNISALVCVAIATADASSSVVITLLRKRQKSDNFIKKVAFLWLFVTFQPQICQNRLFSFPERRIDILRGHLC